MARTETIIVGGGIAATNPFTVGAVPFIVSASPPSITATTVAFFTTGGAGVTPAIILGVAGTDPQPLASETLRTQEGIISEKAASADSTIMGRAIGLVATQAVAIGTQADARASSCVAVGFQASARATGASAFGGGALASANATTALGVGAQATASSGTAVGNNAVASATNAIAVGGGTATASATAAIAIGAASTANGNGAIIIGGSITANSIADVIVIAQGGLTARTNWCVVHGGTPSNLSSAATPLVILGGGAMTVTHAGNIVLGHGFTSFAANVCAIGGTATNSFIGTVVVGRGNTHTASLGGLTIRCTDGVTTSNLAMGDLTIIAPRGTGNAINGSILLQTGVPQASGATSQTARTGAAVKASATAGETDFLLYDVDNATLQRVTVGAADSGGAGFKLLRIPN